jgi:D-glycero-D-manno-heptose 1,7-bisphosphate phosphatase
MVEALGARLEGIYCCPHAPDAGCACRKPALGLLLQAASDLGFNPESAVVIGDKESDVKFGRLAGAATIRITADGAAAPGGTRPDFIAATLLEAAQIITSRRG